LKAAGQFVSIREWKRVIAALTGEILPDKGMRRSSRKQVEEWEA